MEFPSWWKSPDGALKHFLAGPAPDGWERCNGHYNYETGQWVDDAAPKKAGGSDIKALRADYEAKFGKRPFNGWDADTLRAKMA